MYSFGLICCSLSSGKRNSENALRLPICYIWIEDAGKSDCQWAIRHGKCLGSKDGTQLTEEKTSEELQCQDQHNGIRHGVQLWGVFCVRVYVCASIPVLPVFEATSVTYRIATTAVLDNTTNCNENVMKCVAALFIQIVFLFNWEAVSCTLLQSHVSWCKQWW